MKTSNTLLAIVSLILIVLPSCGMKIENAVTETAKVYGNCGMCKELIEKTGNEPGASKVVWNQATQVATITYNPSKTNMDEILKRIAAVGYDNERFTAPDDVYGNLHSCCKYERPSRKP